jgi:hypothetical protein
MSEIKRSRGFFALLTISSCLLCLALMLILFDPLPLLSDIISVARIRWELPRAMERWQAQDISSYQVDIQGAIPLLCFLDGELTVRDHQLIQVRMRENPYIPETPLHLVDPIQWNMNGCSFKDLTVENMFERVETSLEQVKFFGAPLTVKFDKELGYITEYRFGRASRGGIFGYRLSECCTWFEFSNMNVPAP